MHRSIATVSLSGTLRQKLEAIAAAGFDGFELFEADFVNFKGTAAQLRSIAADLGLSIDLYQPFRDFEGMPEPQFRRSLERAERKFDLMEAMGAPMVLCCSNTSPLAIDDPALAAAQLHELAERAACRNLRVGFEALAWGRHTSLYGQAWDIVQRAGHSHLGLILDSFHTLSLKDDPAGIADIPGDKIYFLQMADAPLLSMDVLQWARHHRSFPGQGDFDVVGFFEQVLRAGYTGPLSLEIFNDIFRETPNRRTAVDAMRSLLYLESEARQRLDAPDAQRSMSSCSTRRRCLRSPACRSSSSRRTKSRPGRSARCCVSSAFAASASTAPRP
jgi:4-hydroxyphenylpyruvate dioxygenase